MNDVQTDFSRRQFLRATATSLAMPLGLSMSALALGGDAASTPETENRETEDRSIDSDKQLDDRPLESFQFRDSKGKDRRVEGAVLTKAQDGGLLVQGQDGALWTIEAEHLQERETRQEVYHPHSIDTQARALAKELPTGFEFVSTKHYVVATSAGKPYAQWCAALFERLFGAFHNYFKKREIELHEPEFPLIAIVMRNDREFADYATSDAGPDAATAKGYYSIEHNRIVLYDLSNLGSGAATTAAEISRRVGATPFNIATVVHEATHQIAFNSGLHTRLADNPLWVTEGMAMFFETPDLTNKTGWRTVGQLNDLRHKQFLEFSSRRRRPDSLTTLIQNDTRLTTAETTGDAYAEAWALTYFLAKTRKEAYTKYLKHLSNKPQLVWDTPETRLADFRDHVHSDLKKLDADFLKFIGKAKK